mmetsp:Transcript_331/g.758  ORF Transcript_331/g.758 Transcript_331/m.758 type:complete len:257 (-) Transcript_331:487-1257(-)
MVLHRRPIRVLVDADAGKPEATDAKKININAPKPLVCPEAVSPKLVLHQSISIPHPPSAACACIHPSIRPTNPPIPKKKGQECRCLLVLLLGGGGLFLGGGSGGLLLRGGGLCLGSLGLCLGGLGLCWLLCGILLRCRNLLLRGGLRGGSLLCCGRLLLRGRGGLLRGGAGSLFGWRLLLGGRLLLRCCLLGWLLCLDGSRLHGLLVLLRDLVRRLDLDQCPFLDRLLQRGAHDMLLQGRLRNERGNAGEPGVHRW